MLLPRLIPAMLVDAQLHLVKTTGFGQRRYLGDPLNAAYVFSGFDVDELLVLDIDATPQGRCIPLAFVEALARFTRVPLTVGGGISTLDQIHDLLAAGVEKVVLSSVLGSDFGFLQRAAERFGSSTIAVLLNLAPDGDNAAAAGLRACFGRPDRSPPVALQPLPQLALACEQAGAGELVLQFSGRDGRRTGYAVPPLAALNEQLRLPLVALGGCGHPDHLAELLSATLLSGIAASSLFVYAPGSDQVLLNYPETSAWLRQQLPSWRQGWR